jgi:hypothetical protein
VASLLLSFFTGGNHERENMMCKANYRDKLRQTTSYFYTRSCNRNAYYKNEKGLFFSNALYAVLNTALRLVSDYSKCTYISFGATPNH